MASITIRDLPDTTKEALRRGAAQVGISLEAYARQILRAASTASVAPSSSLADLSRECFGPDHGVDLEMTPRATKRPPVDFAP